MRKVCADWKTEAFSPALVNGSYWPDFEENAKAASAEIFCVPDETAAAQKVLEIADEVKADMVVAAGTEIDRGISLACDTLAQAGKQVFGISSRWQSMPRRRALACRELSSAWGRRGASAWIRTPMRRVSLACCRLHISFSSTAMPW